MCSLLFLTTIIITYLKRYFEIFVTSDIFSRFWRTAALKSSYEKVNMHIKHTFCLIDKWPKNNIIYQNILQFFFCNVVSVSLLSILQNVWIITCIGISTYTHSLLTITTVNLRNITKIVYTLLHNIMQCTCMFGPPTYNYERAMFWKNI